MVSTTYYGASAETLQKSVIAPLEEAINGVEDMTYMTSTASNAGSVSITVYFKQGTDPDMAAVNVQNRVSKATGQLPAEVTQVGVTTSKRQTSILQMFSLYSPDDSYDENFLANYISINLKPQILRISGVGDMMIMGGDYSMRIWTQLRMGFFHGIHHRKNRIGRVFSPCGYVYITAGPPFTYSDVKGSNFLIRIFLVCEQHSKS